MTVDLLRFESGTLLYDPAAPGELPGVLENIFRFDERTGNYRARASDYARTVLALRAGGITFDDLARDYAVLDGLSLKEELTPYPHQKQALDSWHASGGRGVISLPTGAGKTILAVMAIAGIRRSTLVMVPTIDLMIQWCSVLEKFFNIPVGMLGGGSRDIRELTVSTYDSAVLNMEFIGNKFAFLIADECHHLPGPEIRSSAIMSIAPYRLGLSATPELDEERTAILHELMGQTVYHIAIDELEGRILSPYQVRRLYVRLTPDEQRIYNEKREIYLRFMRRYALAFNSGGSWHQFMIACSRMPGGKEAFAAFLEQRKIARGGRAKQELLRSILSGHAGERMIIFTADNDTAYQIGRNFTLPVLTCHTRSAERKDFLDRFRSGEYPVLVTSRVLNEGVDVPSAAVGVVFSGSGSVREHVQRLGRILRPASGKKQAVLYELVSAGTGEEYVSSRRREHSAYRKRR